MEPVKVYVCLVFQMLNVLPILLSQILKSVFFKCFYKSLIDLLCLQAYLALLCTQCVRSTGVDIVGRKVEKQYMQGEGGDQNEFDVFYSLGCIFHSTPSAGWISLGNRSSNLLFRSNLHWQG